MKTNQAVQMDPAYLEKLYAEWQGDPSSLDPSWQFFFQGFDLASCPRSCVAAEQARDQSRVAQLIQAYRAHGHLGAWLDPLSPAPEGIVDLDPGTFGFSREDLDRLFDTGDLHLAQRSRLHEILAALRETYCGPIGVEFLHIQDRRMREWLQRAMEPNRNRPGLLAERKKEILGLLLDAEVLETFIHNRYLGQKRFSLEGGETLIPLLHAIIELSSSLGAEDLLLGMSHRGRLNVLANLLDKPYEAIFGEFEDNHLPCSVCGDGDVKYHKGTSSVHRNRDGRDVRLTLVPNPSHLEVVNPVVLGLCRSRQDRFEDGSGRLRVLPLLVHGDAAFAGQGMVAEVFNLSRLRAYDVGGTVHVVVNNQIGFTTSPSQARSTRYPTDLAKMIEAPIWHVNGDDPEAAVHAAEMALRFRQEFGRDAVIDLVCFRRHGHNEVDEPAFTQPLLYHKIKSHPSVRQVYLPRLIAAGEMTRADDQELSRSFLDRLEKAQAQVKGKCLPMEPALLEAAWRDFDGPVSLAPVETGVALERLREIAGGLTRVPEGFHLHPKLARQVQGRLEAVEKNGPIDWGLAEALAFGALLLEGTAVRFTGQDSERGTFSHRHAVWVDVENGARHVPLAHLGPGQARLLIENSPLSEQSVLGFEYGYSLGGPRTQVIWEAQFGDFVNGAQVVIDQFVAASQSKWQRPTGLVLLLPHGFEGQGPEHSNAYLERFLLAAAENCMQVVVPSTPAQYFHVLRRQTRRAFRRPLVLFTPKSLLRLPAAFSQLPDLVVGRFETVLGDPRVDSPGSVERVVLCAGKVYYDLDEARVREKVERTAILRIEQLYPFPADALRGLLTAFPRARDFVWAQEEPRNRGGWNEVGPRWPELFPERAMRYAGRKRSASPAVGSLKLHKLEQAALVNQALGIAGEVIHECRDSDS